MNLDRPVVAAPENMILITQGEYAVTDKPNIVINTLLGSCVSCCLWDDRVGVGGMNHLLLGGELKGATAGYDLAGVTEMECLINGIIKLGGRRENLKAKVFGGAKMVEGLGKIGDKNAQFAFDFLEQERIPCVKSSVGGTSARAVRFWAASGRVAMRLVGRDVEEKIPPPAAVPTGNGLELF